MAVVTIPESGRAGSAQAWCAQLEEGDILYFPRTPIALAAGDVSFLLGQQQADSSLHKNIAYKPALDALSGVDTKTADAAAVEQLRGVMRGYSSAVVAFLEGFLSPYQKRWRLDYASFRPQEESRPRPAAAQAERPAAHRRFPDAADRRRADLALFHQHSSRADARLGGRRAVPGDGRAVCAG